MVEITAASWNAVGGGVLGLLVGSFLNVVIHRLPQMMERQWAAELAAAHDADTERRSA